MNRNKNVPASITSSNMQAAGLCKSSQKTTISNDKDGVLFGLFLSSLLFTFSEPCCQQICLQSFFRMIQVRMFLHGCEYNILTKKAPYTIITMVVCLALLFLPSLLFPFSVPCRQRICLQPPFLRMHGCEYNILPEKHNL